MTFRNSQNFVENKDFSISRENLWFIFFPLCIFCARCLYLCMNNCSVTHSVSISINSLLFLYLVFQTDLILVDIFALDIYLLNMSPIHIKVRSVLTVVTDSFDLEGRLELWKRILILLVKQLYNHYMEV